jgi:putative acetyltransferase
MASEIAVRRADPRGQDVQRLLAASDAYSRALYPEHGRHPVDVEFLASPSVRFFVARLDGEAVGCVALVIMDDNAAELKRMIVLPEARGRGIGSSLLSHAERAAVVEGTTLIRLETGPRSGEALNLYRHHGYRECGAFGSYKEGPHSFFLEKQLPISP